MPTQQFPVSVGNVTSVQVSGPVGRVYLLIQNYKASTNNLYVKFGSAATAGSGGEIEIQPGAHWEWGFTTAWEYDQQLNAPQEAIDIISDGTATGCITQLTLD